MVAQLPGCALVPLRSLPLFTDRLPCRVAASLVANILFGLHTLFDMSASTIDVGVSEGDHGPLWDGREEEPYVNGEYKLVLQLVAVLQV